jgi:hypothetical protein
MSSLESYHLKENPFTIVPSRTNPFWADRTKFKGEIEKAIEFTLYGVQSQIIACIYGDWGCGKTHAMNYFSNEDILRKIADIAKVPADRALLSIPTIFPINEVFNSLYLDIIYRHFIPKLAEILELLSKQKTAIAPLEVEGSLEGKLKELGVSEDMAKVLPQLTTRDMLVRRYLSRTASRGDLTDLGVAKGIETNGEMLTSLTDVMKLFTKTKYSRIFIWIDDCERIDEVPGKAMFEFQYFLRDILDLMPERLTLIVNFTLYPGEEIAERIKYLGPAVQSRISKKITVGYFNHDDYLQYIDDLLENSRKKPRGATIPKYFPFSQGCLDNLFQILEKSTSNLQPRTVNRVLSSLLEGGLRENIPLIDDKYLEKVKEEVQTVMAS